MTDIIKKDNEMLEENLDQVSGGAFKRREPINSDSTTDTIPTFASACPHCRSKNVTLRDANAPAAKDVLDAINNYVCNECGKTFALR